MQSLPAPLAGLRDWNQFIVWQSVPTGNGKPRKVPTDPRTLRPCDPHRPEQWLTADEALRLGELLGFGVGFVLTANDPFLFVDIDACRTGDDWSPLAHEILNRFPGACVEVSTSGDGLHILATGNTPEHSCKNTPLNLEYYSTARFVALTGDRASGDILTNVSAALPSFVSTYFPPTRTAAEPLPTDGPVPEWDGPADDTALIRRMVDSRSARSAFGGSASFRDLWEANADVLAKAYPPQGGSSAGWDQSSADMALAQHLAFWTGKDRERMVRLMHRSALVRDKWEREDYMQRTVNHAVSIQTDVYTAKRNAPTPGPVTPVSPPSPGETIRAAPETVTGYQYLGQPQQLEFFAGCVYIREEHRVLTPWGERLRPEAFNVAYGGYEFQMDDGNKRQTRSAWEAFTVSQMIRHPQVSQSIFRPPLEFGTILEEEGISKVNIYRAIETPAMEGDPGPFLTHLCKLVPDERDRQILLSYMAAVVQYPGVKFQWAPLIQGVEGNGKTFLSWCVAAAVGDRYSHFPNADNIAEKYNRWLFENIFIAVEDIYVPGHRQEILESLKPMVTNRKMEMRAMQADKDMRENHANFIFNSNHRDALRKTRNDRRFAVFYTAQQEYEHLVRDGLDNGYFHDLYRWADDDGYAIITHYLRHWSIPDEFNPAGRCNRAPVTSSTPYAVAESLTTIEQEISEAIAENITGFCGGWISSVALSRLLSSLRLDRSVTPNRRRDILKDMGYDQHPSLPDGRTHNPVPIDDGKKPRLFIHRDNPDIRLTVAADIVHAYVQAQTRARFVENPPVPPTQSTTLPKVH